jgi:hypothetical protein
MAHKLCEAVKRDGVGLPGATKFLRVLGSEPYLFGGHLQFGSEPLLHLAPTKALLEVVMGVAP